MLRVVSPPQQVIMAMVGVGQVPHLCEQARNGETHQGKQVLGWRDYYMQ